MSDAFDPAKGRRQGYDPQRAASNAALAFAPRQGAQSRRAMNAIAIDRSGAKAAAYRPSAAPHVLRLAEFRSLPNRVSGFGADRGARGIEDIDSARSPSQRAVPTISGGVRIPEVPTDPKARVLAAFDAWGLTPDELARSGYHPEDFQSVEPPPNGATNQPADRASPDGRLDVPVTLRDGTSGTLSRDARSSNSDTNPIYFNLAQCGLGDCEGRLP